MQLTGLLWGRKLLNHVSFPCAEVLGPEASVEEIKDLIRRKGHVFVKPIFQGGVGKKGKFGLIGKATNIGTALAEKERLYFIDYEFKGTKVKADGVTFEGNVNAEEEIYFSISESTEYRSPVMTVTHHGGMDIEELPQEKLIVVPFDPLTGLKSFQIANALNKLGAPNHIFSPLVQKLPSLWTLYNHYGLNTLELNPIRMSLNEKGRFVPIACDFKCSFDIDDSAWKRLHLPNHIFASNYSEFEQEINQLRTYQGQSDVVVINETGTITAPTFGGGANALVTELLGDRATISSDFGGNPPYEKMLAISRIVYKYWLRQSNVLLIIGGKANNTSIYETFRGIGDGLRWYFQTYGPTPVFVVVGRGGPNLIRGMGYLRDVLETLGLPYRFFGHDSAMSEVINYVVKVDDWMKNGGSQSLAEKMKIPGSESGK
ncbi:MAG: carboxylate--amine ligase [bacterium]|nr:carboxylate--amine ligase [bacterium]